MNVSSVWRDDYYRITAFHGRENTLLIQSNNSSPLHNSSLNSQQHQNSQQNTVLHPQCAE